MTCDIHACRRFFSLVQFVPLSFGSLLSKCVFTIYEWSKINRWRRVNFNVSDVIIFTTNVNHSEWTAHKNDYSRREEYAIILVVMKQMLIRTWNVESEKQRDLVRSFDLERYVPDSRSTHINVYIFFLFQMHTAQRSVLLYQWIYIFASTMTTTTSDSTTADQVYVSTELNDREHFVIMGYNFRKLPQILSHSFQFCMEFTMLGAKKQPASSSIWLNSMSCVLDYEN